MPPDGFDCPSRVDSCYWRTSTCRLQLSLEGGQGRSQIQLHQFDNEDHGLESNAGMFQAVSKRLASPVLALSLQQVHISSIRSTPHDLAAGPGFTLATTLRPYFAAIHPRIARNRRDARTERVWYLHRRFDFTHGTTFGH